MYPVLFEIPGIGWPIYSYGVMLGISIIAGWYLTLYLAEADGLPRKLMGSCYFWGIAAALAGARLLYLITNPDEFHTLADFFRFREGGLVAYGGFLGGLFGSYLYCRVKKINIWAWADATAAPIALGLALTRVGCFLYGCCYGRRVTDDDPSWLHSIALQFPNWEARFPELAEHNLRGAPAFSHHVAHLGLEGAAEASFVIAPTQVMASINGFIAVGIIFLLRRYRNFRGLLFMAFGVYYGLARFFFEIVRDDTQRGTVGPDIFGWYGGFEGKLTTSQVIAIVTVLASVAGIVFFHLRARKDPERAMSLGEGIDTLAKEEEKDQGKKARRSASKRRKKK